jgi:hypothetical protein
VTPGLAKEGKSAAILASLLYVVCDLTAAAEVEAGFFDWQGELYGGRYYDDDRIGAYGIASLSGAGSLTVMGEVLGERYTDGYGDYDFSGLGAHLLWNVAEFARLGAVGSHSKEQYSYDQDFGERESDYVTDTVAVEAEIARGPVALAAQFGQTSSDYYRNDHGYFSIDAYYWGSEYSWYGRGAIRRTKNFEEYTLEAYRTFYLHGLPLTAYTGATRNDLTTKEEVLAYHTTYDAFYAGCYIEFATTASSAWNLWFEVSKQDTDTLFSIEINLTFGPGADAPYISSFGFNQ